MAEFDFILKRQWEMLKLLSKSAEGMSLVELAEKFACSEKTIKRDLKSIESVFGKLKTHNEAHGRKRYLFDHNPFTFGLTLDRNELLAIYIGQTLMTPLKGTIFWESVESGRDKIKKILREDTVKYAERVAPFFYRFEPTERRYSERTRAMVDVALQAMASSRALSIRYRSLRAQRSKTYDIHPYNFVYWRGAVYLVGYCCRDRKIKIWKVDRLSDAKLLAHKKFRRIEFDVERYLSNVVEPYVGGAPVVRATVRFTGYAARIVQEEKLKAFHAIREVGPNEVIAQLDVEVGKTFTRWILGFGVHAEILDPPDLRASFLEELRDVERIYSEPPRIPGVGVRYNADEAADRALQLEQAERDEVDGEFAYELEDSNDDEFDIDDDVYDVEPPAEPPRRRGRPPKSSYFTAEDDAEDRADSFGASRRAVKQLAAPEPQAPRKRGRPRKIRPEETAAPVSASKRPLRRDETERAERLAERRRIETLRIERSLPADLIPEPREHRAASRKSVKRRVVKNPSWNADQTAVAAPDPEQTPKKRGRKPNASKPTPPFKSKSSSKTTVVRKRFKGQTK